MMHQESRNHIKFIFNYNCMLIFLYVKITSHKKRLAKHLDKWWIVRLQVK